MRQPLASSYRTPSRYPRWGAGGGHARYRDHAYGRLLWAPMGVGRGHGRGYNHTPHSSCRTPIRYPRWGADGRGAYNTTLPRLASEVSSCRTPIRYPRWGAGGGHARYRVHPYGRLLWAPDGGGPGRGYNLHPSAHPRVTPKCRSEAKPKNLPADGTHNVIEGTTATPTLYLDP